MRRHLLVPLLGLMLSTACLAAAPGALIRACELKSQPFLDADTVTRLPAGAPLTVANNQGGWSRIQTADGQQGWVRLLNVRLAKPEQPTDVGKTVLQLGNVVRTGTSKSTATTGAKGLSREEIGAARPNPQEIRRLEAFKATPRDAEQFAAARRLRARDIALLTP